MLVTNIWEMITYQILEYDVSKLFVNASSQGLVVKNEQSNFVWNTPENVGSIVFPSFFSQCVFFFTKPLKAGGERGEITFVCL